jgi:hypothetical protein
MSKAPSIAQLAFFNSFYMVAENHLDGNDEGLLFLEQLGLSIGRLYCLPCKINGFQLFPPTSFEARYVICFIETVFSLCC